MNRKKLVTIIVSVVLAVAIILGGVWFFFLKGEDSKTSAPAEKIDALRLTRPVETLFETDFTDIPWGSLPDDWDKTHPYVFLQNGDKATALATSGGNNSHLTVRQLFDEGCLSFGGRDGEHILTMPYYGENYMVTATVVFDSFKTPFGFATDISDDYKSATSATLLTLSAADTDQNPDDDIQILVPTFTLSRRTKGDSDYTARDADTVSVPAADVDRSAVTVSDRDTGAGTITPDTEVVFKIIHFGDVSYFYMNDKLIGSMEDQSNAEFTRFGFFSDAQGREVKVKQLRVDSLTLGSSITDEIDVLATEREDDLTSLTELPEGYKLYSGQWLDKNTMGTAVAETDGIRMTSSEGATALMLPVQPAKDYKFTASFKKGDGTFGLVICVGDPLSGSRGGSFFTVNDNSVSLYNLTVKKRSEVKEYALSDIPGLTLSDTAELTVYSFDGIGYFFINGVYVTHLELFQSGKDTEFCGIYSEESTGFKVTSVKTELLIEKETVAKLRISDSKLITDGSGKISLTTSAELSKNNVFSKYMIDGKEVEFGILAAPSDGTAKELKLTDKDLITLKCGDMEEVSAAYRVTAELALSTDNISSCYTFRGYVSSGGKYYYGEPQVYSPAVEASSLYLELSDKEKAAFDTLFKGIEGYIGKYEKTLTFTLFSDFHYKQGMYSTSIADMQAILDRANKSKSAFILSAGDFCNDIAGSPELLNTYLNNNYNLPAYNIYGNHELESGNTMQGVTPLLTNDKNVVWGTENGKIGDGSIAYYYFDCGDFRIVCTDTNYSYNQTEGEWQHNTTGSYGPPAGNIKGNSLGPVQLQWLEEVLFDAADKGKACIVVGHDSFAGRFASTSPDASTIRDIYSRVNAQRKGTVLLSINGHIHTNNLEVVEDVLYFDMNTTRNGVWKGTGTEHYTDKHTFDYVEYDASGNPVNSYKKSLGELSMGKNTWFFEDPLSATVSISQYGTITVEGMESRWIYGVNPENTRYDQVPKVTSGTWELVKK